MVTVKQSIGSASAIQSARRTERGGAAVSMHYKLPEVGGFDLWRRGAAINDLGAQNELHVLAGPVLWRLGFDGFHVAGLGEELAGCNGASASNAGDYDS